MAEDTTFVAQPDAISQLYAGLPVSTKHIRILKIFGCEEGQSDDAPLRCHLDVADLETAPKYAALSYVWGTYSCPPKNVCCNGIALPVTTNCHSALQRLRTMLGTFTLWVDAICINQEEVKDKMHQIGIMGDIYSNAKTTYVWLGEGTEITDRVMAYLDRAGFLECYYQDPQAMKQKFKNLKVYGAFMSYCKSRWGFSRSTIPYRAGRFSISISLSDVRVARLRSDECSTKELAEFFDCIWMSRIWTFQEIILSPNPIIVRGVCRLSWERLEHSIMFLMTVQNNQSVLDWADIVLTRDLFRSGAQDFATYESPLLRYADFCVHIANFSWWWRVCRWVIPFLVTHICTVISVIFAVWYSQTHEHQSRWQSIFRISPIPFFYIRIWATFGVTGLAPNPGYYILANTLQVKQVRSRLRDNLHKRLVEALRTRGATETKDMSWGLRSVLMRLHGDAPSMNFELSVSEVYQQLTRYLLLKDDCLQILSLAAQKRCDGTPSWVPDYSEKLEYLNDDSHSQFMRDYCHKNFESHSYYKFCDPDQQVLAVKGFILGRVTLVEQDRTLCARSESLYPSREETFHSISLSDDAQVGDKVALVAGVPTLLVLRDNDGYMNIITACKLQPVTSLTKALDRESGLTGLWRYHENKRKKEWIGARGWEFSRVHMREVKPHMYLEDILIA